VDHVVDRRALAGLLMRCAHEQPLLVGSHFRATLAGADSKQLYDEKIEFQNELPNVFVLPDTFIHFWWRLADFLHIRGVRSCTNQGVKSEGDLRLKLTY